MTLEVVRLDPAKQSQVTAALAGAFEQDLVKIRLAPRAKSRRRLLNWLMGGVVRYCLACGEIYTDREVSGAACWLPPGQTDLRFWDTLKAWGLVPGTLWAMTPAQILVSLRMQAMVEKQHKRLMPGLHWYLFLLGVIPERQGQGIGGKLIEPVLRRSDLEGLPCYLETQTQENVMFYQKRGFRIVYQGVPRGLGLPIWFMVREPKQVDCAD